MVKNNHKPIDEVFQVVTYFMTKKYHLFHSLPFNRAVCGVHVNELAESMTKHGFKGVVQIIKTSFIEGVKRMYILDGQHRIVAAMRLGIPFAFELTELKTLEETADFISTLNNSAKGWGTSQFLKVWAGLGLPEYLKLQEVFHSTGFQITPLVEAYTYSQQMKPFRAGKMKFPNEAESDLIIEQLVEMNKFLPKKAFCRRTIIRLMRQPKYNHKTMMSAVKKYVDVCGNFSENETELREQFQKLIDVNC